MFRPLPHAKIVYSRCNSQVDEFWSCKNENLKENDKNKNLWNTKLSQLGMLPKNVIAFLFTQGYEWIIYFFNIWSFYLGFK